MKKSKNSRVFLKNNENKLPNRYNEENKHEKTGCISITGGQKYQGVSYILYRNDFGYTTFNFLT